MKKTNKTMKIYLASAIGALIFALIVVCWNHVQMKRFEKAFANPETTHITGPQSVNIPIAGIDAQLQNALIECNARDLSAVPVDTDLVQSANPESVDAVEVIEEEVKEMNTPKPEPITYESANHDAVTNPDVMTDKHYEVLESYGMDETMYVSEWLVNVRQKPGTDFDVVTTLPAGTEVTVSCIGYDTDGNKWAQIGEGKFIRMDLLADHSPLMYMGEYLITYYCACAKCCDVETGITASGAHVQEGVTCAADASIPFGTKLQIGGHVYTVQDRGGAIKGKHIDIYIDGHQRALQQDMGSKDVFMVVEP